MDHIITLWGHLMIREVEVVEGTHTHLESLREEDRLHRVLEDPVVVQEEDPVEVRSNIIVDHLVVHHPKSIILLPLIIG
jgi:hypothetical protein